MPTSNTALKGNAGQFATELQLASVNQEALPIHIHPRVFAALGADLVTDDVVAVVELVKNSYDAFAHNVWVRFTEDSNGNLELEIEDDGHGMSRESIENSWFVVATPLKQQNPYVKKGNKTRRVVGEKGLGRLSAARLGTKLLMQTKADQNPCWEVVVDWDTLFRHDRMEDCSLEIRKLPDDSRVARAGTYIKISSLRSIWKDKQIANLENGLRRIINPLFKSDDFKIHFLKPGSTELEKIEITSHDFLENPKYRIYGHSDKYGNVNWKYEYSSIDCNKSREYESKLYWEQIFNSIQESDKDHLSSESVQCGPFSFEVRAWDLQAEDTEEIADKYEIRKNEIRKSISAFKGISVYRDNVLILPKTENSRDWLGLDARRIARVGTRLSTSQIVGYVSISSEDNPGIKDTSDRERLADCVEVEKFREILRAIVGLFEVERDEDRIKREIEKPMKDLFAQIEPQELFTNINSKLKEGADSSEVIQLMDQMRDSLAETRNTIQSRFVYYSRLATIGTIAFYLIHEIRNKTFVIGGLIRVLEGTDIYLNNTDIKKACIRARESIHSLERLADTFAPLASRNFRRRARSSVLEERIKSCIELQQISLESKHIVCVVPDSITKVAADPGELDTIILNLITNSEYWLCQIPKAQRKLIFECDIQNSGKFVRITVSDTGPGIEKEDLEKVFLPGVTRKPNGLGMGLTVAAELASIYNGNIHTIHTNGNGAVFVFDLPLLK